MMNTDVDKIAADLSKTALVENSVSFFGQGLKLDDKSSADVIVKALEDASHIDIFELSGNTIGVEAGKAIGVALGKHPEVKRLLWKDTFTGRLKTEIAPALNGMTACLRSLPNVNLVELDFSDIAFGPNGVVGITDLLASAACHNLEILRMDNEGLGHQGCKHLTTALQTYIFQSKTAGLQKLRIFTAGRNRLENVGIKMIADVFSQINSLEEFAVFQNGIGIHGLDGIHDLVRIFKANPRLRKINISDNTINPDGAEIFVTCINQLEYLEELNLSDCLLKDSGAEALAAALFEAPLNKLSKLILSGNELTASAAVSIAASLEKKTQLTVLDLNCNELGSGGIEQLQGILNEHGQLETLASLSDDEGSASEGEDGASDGEDEHNSTVIENDSVSASDAHNASVGLFANLESSSSTPSIFNTAKNPFGGSKPLFDFKAAAAASSSPGIMKPSVLSSLLAKPSEADLSDFVRAPSVETLARMAASSAAEVGVYARHSQFPCCALVSTAAKISALAASGKEEQFVIDVIVELMDLAVTSSPSLFLNHVLVELGLLKSEEDKNRLKTCSALSSTRLMQALLRVTKKAAVPSSEQRMLHSCLNSLWPSAEQRPGVLTARTELLTQLAMS